MTTFGDILGELKWRGLIHQLTDAAEMEKSLSARCWTLYAGFDPTADSLHVGSLLPLLTLRDRKSTRLNSSH